MKQPLRTRSIRTLAIIVIGALTFAVLLGLALTRPHLSGASMWGWHYDVWNDGHMAGWDTWGWGMMLLGLLWLAELIALIVYALTLLADQPVPESTPGDPALAALREQYARGEIDDDEFERRRNRLAADH